jgi:two-component system, LytTR family, response regulator
MMIKAVIVDDEKPSREVIREYLDNFCSKDVEVVGMADSMKTALDMIRLYRPDLVFLDIDMPNGNGFDLLREIQPIHFKVVFITAYSEYAVKAFRFYATDYLLKPVDIYELKDAVSKVKNEMEKELDYSNIRALLDHQSHQSEEFNDLIVNNEKGFKVFKINEIIYCQADTYCTNIYLTGNRKVICTKNLKYYQNLLEGHGFIRSHNSYLINLKHIVSFQNQGVIKLTGDVQVPLGQTYRKLFLLHFRQP